MLVLFFLGSPELELVGALGDVFSSKQPWFFPPAFLGFLGICKDIKRSQE